MLDPYNCYNYDFALDNVRIGTFACNFRKTDANTKDNANANEKKRKHIRISTYTLKIKTKKKNKI